MLAVLYAVFNIVSVTAIVAVNKYVFKVIGFPLPTLLVCIHSVSAFDQINSSNK